MCWSENRRACRELNGFPKRSPAAIATLADRLQLRHHTVVEPVDRLVQRGLVGRRGTEQDRREVVVEVRAPGQRRMLDKLVKHSIAELRAGGAALVKRVQRLIGLSQRRRASA